MSQTELTISLHNGISIPLFGLDTIRYSEAEAYAAVTNALENGIRHIETASDYGTEKIIGQAIHDSPIPRSSLFVTDEINGINNTEAMIRSAEAAIRRLDLDYIDLLLMAWNGGETETDPANENVYKAWSIFTPGRSNICFKMLRLPRWYRMSVYFPGIRISTN